MTAKKFIEGVKRGSRAVMSIVPRYRYAETSKRVMTGHLTLTAYDRDGNNVYRYETPNVIVDGASTLIARLLKEAGTSVKGIEYLAVGVGDAAWNLQMPPSPTPDRTRLYKEIARKRVSYSQYVNPTTGQPSEDPTNIVDYVFTFNEGEAVGPLVECGMFGNATSDLNSGILVNYRTFPVLNKTEEMSFSIVFRITT